MPEIKPVSGQPLIPEAKPAPWSTALERLKNPEKYRTYWLATVRPDGRPHIVPLLGLWLNGRFYFLTGEKTRRGKNLARDGRCSLAVDSQTIPALDLVFEGEATKLVDDDRLRQVAGAYGSQMGWPLEVRDGAVFGPS